jgi:hypothetical protein
VNDQEFGARPPFWWRSHLIACSISMAPAIPRSRQLPKLQVVQNSPARPDDQIIFSYQLKLNRLLD